MYCNEIYNVQKKDKVVLDQTIMLKILFAKIWNFCGILESLSPHTVWGSLLLLGHTTLHFRIQIKISCMYKLGYIQNYVFCIISDCFAYLKLHFLIKPTVSLLSFILCKNTLFKIVQWDLNILPSF